MPPCVHASAVRPARYQRRVRAGARGLSLIELVMFIVVVSAALAGVLNVFITATAGSADPMLRRQALAIAQSILEEVQLMPFTYCDPDDSNVETAASSGACAAVLEVVGAEAGENRFGPPQFDNVNDYHGYTMAGVVDITNTAVAGLSGYSASVSVTSATLGSIAAGSGDALRITVSVSGPHGTVVSLDGYRARHAPNATL